VKILILIQDLIDDVCHHGCIGERHLVVHKAVLHLAAFLGSLGNWEYDIPQYGATIEVSRVSGINTSSAR
jgi:hypothetical protein